MERNAARRRRRVLLGHCLRGTASVVLLTALYFMAPLEGGFGLLTVLTLVLGLLAFGLLTAWQVSAIARSEYPRLSALEAMATAVPLFLIVFSATYFMLSESVPGTFSEPLNRTDALYFTVTVFATVGFGDIVPVTGTGRVLTTVQMVADLIVVGVIAKALFGAMKIAMRRRRTGDLPLTDEDDGP
ncbi:potassium channel family protein [Streptomyces virginiae]|uniref:potassium channel family protein n=1 Tax=Streptomyces virginiae TaxID=1961 RepID=UPI002DBAABE6|nr:potassium channel family protein [Streptomyces sp. CMAA1738]MEC4569754.1 potassium channel family protein [Streptomyces sp. CMAA1738]